MERSNAFETRAELTDAEARFPTQWPGDMMVLDNLSVHKGDGLNEIAKKYGVRLRYLPPYSPDFNPIELAFSKLKTWLCTAKARIRDLLEETILAVAA